MDAILWTENLSVHFGGLAAINRVNFIMQAGEVKALIGPNGAGKTTLYNLISGNLKPTAGSIFFQGTEITGLPPHEISRRGLSRTFQKTSLFPNLTVRENIRLGGQNGYRHKIDLFMNADRIQLVQEKVEALLELVGLQDKAGQKTINLSHGDQRLLEIAVGLSTKPSLLLLDEPTAGLSVKETWDMTEKVKELSRSSIHNMIIVEHDMEVVKEVASSICVLYNGEILCDGTIEQVKSNPKVQEIYWGI